MAAALGALLLALSLAAPTWSTNFGVNDTNTGNKVTTSSASFNVWTPTSAGAGSTPPPVNLASPTYNAYEPALAVDPSSSPATIYGAWIDDSSGNLQLHVGVYEWGAWHSMGAGSMGSDKVLNATSTDNAVHPAMGIDVNGSTRELWVAWIEYSGATPSSYSVDVAYCVLPDTTCNFGGVVILTTNSGPLLSNASSPTPGVAYTSAGEDLVPRIAIADLSHVMYVTTIVNDNGCSGCADHIETFDDPGGTWGSITAHPYANDGGNLNSGNDEEDVSIGLGPDGNLYETWVQLPGTSASVTTSNGAYGYLSMWNTATSTWATAVQINYGSYVADDVARPTLVAGSSTTMYVAYRLYQGNNSCWAEAVDSYDTSALTEGPVGGGPVDSNCMSGGSLDGGPTAFTGGGTSYQLERYNAGQPSLAYVDGQPWIAFSVDPTASSSPSGPYEMEVYGYNGSSWVPEQLNGTYLNSNATDNAFSPALVATPGSYGETVYAMWSEDTGGADYQLQAQATGGSTGYDNAAISSDASPATADMDEEQGGSYSATALADATPPAGPGQTVTATVSGTSYSFVWPDFSPGEPDDYQTQPGEVIPLGAPEGMATLGILGAADHAGSAGATGTVTVTYSDGSTSTATLTLADWTLGQGTYSVPSADATAITCTYRNTPSGQQTETNYVFATTVPLDSTKQVVSVTLPAVSSNGVLHVFAIGAPTSDSQNGYNDIGISPDSANSASFDDGGKSYSAVALAGASPAFNPGSTVSAGGFTFMWPAGSTDVGDNYQTNGQVIPVSLTPGSSSLGVLGAADEANTTQSCQVTITYTDSTTSLATLIFPDWVTGTGSVPAGGSVAASMSYRNTQSGTAETMTVDLYTYSLPVDSAKTVAFLTLCAQPASGGLDHVFAVS